MILPVEVQQPNKPQTARFVGRASSDLTPEEVAALVGVPDESFLEGKIIRSRKKGDRWSLVADVRFSDEGGKGGVCPHCGKPL